MVTISTSILLLFGVAVGFIAGLILGAGLTVIGMCREEKRHRRGMWHMNLLETGKTIQEFFDCPSISLKFPELDKNISKAYEIRISQINEGKSGVAKYVRDKSTKTDVLMEWYE